MVRTQIQLTEKQLELLKKNAEARRISVAELIRQAVDMLIDSGTIIDVEERRRRAIAAAGRFHSQKKDLSSRHDDYLAEDFNK